MTVGQWLATRTPAPPALLAARLREALGAHLGDCDADVYDVTLARAEAMLAEQLRLDCATRDRALDLLAVDAMVTYAFEAACESPATLSARATDAMHGIAALVTPSVRA